MPWELEDTMLAQLRKLWELAPPGRPVRELTGRLATALDHTTGPEEAMLKGTSILGDVNATYLATLALKLVAGEVDTLLHAAGIAAALPYVLADGEYVQGISVDHHGRGTAGAAALGVGDLVTNLQVAEFTFIHWRMKGNGARESKLLADLVKLDLLDDTRAEGRRRVLYVAGGGPAVRFLGGATTIVKKLKNNGVPLRRFIEHYGNRFTTVGAYWAHIEQDKRVSVVDLYEVAPTMRPPE